MNKARKVLMAGVALPTVLTACGSNDSITAPVNVAPTPPTAATPLQEGFGATFLGIFNRDMNAGEAVEPASGAVPPLDLNSEGFTG